MFNMKRNLLTQMRNEWKGNFWLIIELAVVLLVVWGLSTVLYAQLIGLTYPKGFNPDNVFSLTVVYAGSNSPDYIKVDNDTEAYYEDLNQLIRRLKNNPNVEAVALHYNSMPYLKSGSSGFLTPVEGNDSVFYDANFRYATPDIINVLGIESLTGVTPEKLMDMLKNGELLISDSRRYQQSGRDPMSLKGKNVYLGNDSTKKYRIGDVVRQIRRTEYEVYTEGGNVIYPLNEEYPGMACNILLKLKPGHIAHFYEDFENNTELRKQRNVTLCDLTSLIDYRKMSQKDDEVNIRVYISIILLLMITVFLGLAGSFWFRVRQRVGEIAIRKVCGANKKQIFIRIITEGLILLLAAVIIVSLIIWPMADKMIETYMYTTFALKGGLLVDLNVVFMMELLSVILIAVGIIVSLWFPASKAMKIEPAIAIKAE